MIKNVFFLAFICVLVSCQKDSDQLNSNDQLNSKELVTSNKLSNSDYRGLPIEVRDFIVSGGATHLECEVTNNKESLGIDFSSGGSDAGSGLGTSAYPYASNMSLIKLLNSSLPCQPSIPYFIYGSVDDQGGDIFSDGYSVTFRLILNPSYNSLVKVVDVDWELNGQNDQASVGSLTIDDLRIGQSNSVTCRVFSTDNNVTVYSQEMELDFQMLLNLGGGNPSIEYLSEYTFPCVSGGTNPIIAP